jgi:hypothetical protein
MSAISSNKNGRQRRVPFKIIQLLAIISLTQSSVFSQEKYGHTLNLGIGVGGNYGYYNYIGSTIPVLHLDYEIEAAKYFTLAPFINAHSYTRVRKWGNNNFPDRDYRYRETALAVGLKGAYYFDNIVKAGSKWDFYLAGSIGFMQAFARWDDGYDGDRNYYQSPNRIYLDLHAGAEYKISKRTGIFLDLSTGISTLGLAFHGIQ